MECGIKPLKFDDSVDVDSTYYRSLIRSLRYLTWMRLDIMYSVGIGSRFMKKLKSSLLKAAKRKLRTSKFFMNNANVTMFNITSFEIRLKRMRLKCCMKIEDQVVADIFTKPLKIDALRKFKSLLGMIDEREFGLRES
ncbi:uncharacterized protein LOC120291633 [Eucalyptus grandis]|uniref:uncharacterized protein LOC120291633 n=1 Tax=Eucalyptus grandis TaxID=71139 RepID=UPI00192E77CD|nr:uncharacterized protein LOC120291633 [Eucalyptus grandis]